MKFVQLASKLYSASLVPRIQFVLSCNTKKATETTHVTDENYSPKKPFVKSDNKS